MKNKIDWVLNKSPH